MAQTLITTCDVHADGTTPAVKSVALSVGRRSWKVDVCAAHEEELLGILDRFSPNSKKKAGSDAAAAKARRDAIREWGKKNKVKVPQRGRISREIEQAFDAAQKKSR